MLGKKMVKFAALMLVVVGGSALAAGNDIGTIANSVTSTFQSIGKLMAAVAYLAGFGLTIGAIFKFKQHKDNPQQVQMGIPITMLLVGIALIFLPNLIQPAGTTLFGSSAVTGGFTGAGVTSMPGGNGT